MKIYTCNIKEMSHSFVTRCTHICGSHFFGVTTNTTTGTIWDITFWTLLSLVYDTAFGVEFTHQLLKWDSYKLNQYRVNDIY